jgi:addiction module RelE/StbE family toxin
MGKKIIWATEAFADLQHIHAYIARDSAVIADSFIEKVFASVTRLERFPFLGPKVREWVKSPYRHLIVSPYRIIYRVDKRTVYIIAIAHGAQELKRFLRDRN